MRIIKPSFHIEDDIDGVGICKKIEKAAKTCYQSEGNITGDSYIKFIKKLIKIGHHSVLEHEKITVRFVIDRGISHEAVRHRLSSFSQSSTRFCNYFKDRFDNEIKVIKPLFWDEDSTEYRWWKEAMFHAEKYYMELIKRGAKPQEARSVLPNSLATEIVITSNLRQWRTIFEQRALNIKAHPQMREVMVPLLKEFQRRIPVIFDDLILED